MKNKITTESAATEIRGGQDKESYLQPFLSRAPEKNNGVIAKNLLHSVQWLKEHGASFESHQLVNSEIQSAIESAKVNGMDVLDRISKSLSMAAEDDEEVSKKVEKVRDHKHCEQVYSKMMQERSIEPFGNEFFGLVIHGKGLITSGFSTLRE